MDSSNKLLALDKDEKLCNQLNFGKCANQSMEILDVKRTLMSEVLLSNIQIAIPRKIHSELNIDPNINYDDLCGPWVYLSNPVYHRYDVSSNPHLCTWEFITKEDIIYLKKHHCIKERIISFFEKTLQNNLCSKKGNDIFVKVLWEFFKFTRDQLFSEEAISAALGLLYLTHLFFLSHGQRAAGKVHQFFYETLLLHTALNPPKSSEVFTTVECQMLLKLFHKLYIDNLTLLRVICHPNYCIIMSLSNTSCLI